MPVLDGRTTAIILKEMMTKKEISPIVLIGSSANNFNMEEYDEKSHKNYKVIDYFLPKPIMQEELVKTFKQILRRL